MAVMMRKKMSSEEIACHNCGEDTQDYLTKHDEDFWLCDICEKEE